MRVMPIEIVGDTRLAEVCLHVMAGEPEKDIAHKVGLSVHTVHAYVKKIYKKTGVKSRPELLAKMVGRLAARVIMLESGMITIKQDEDADSQIALAGSTRPGISEPLVL